jgi:type I restriction enzyme S subunit
VRPRDNLTTEFAAFALRAPYFVERVVANSTGVSFPAINESELSTYELTIPPESEQRTIAAFLDRETARIDALVSKNEQLIELLQEKRTALITSAVTKGLDPSVPMKDTGVDWLGEIPAHWEVKPLRWALSVRSGEALSNTEFELAQQDGLHVVVIGGNGVIGYTSRENIDVPSLAIGRVGALCGNIHLVDPPAWITDNALVVSDIRGFDRVYLSLVLRVLDLNRWASQSAQPLITGGFVKAQLVCAPPVDDQRAIAAFLDRETARIDALVAKVHEAIDRVKELRTALISAAVTGKIDVRQEAV